jgi:monoamine oxidase
MSFPERHQVVVVGAGVAGMVAARRLADSGLDVVVLEARDRVGGRLWSHRLSNDEVVELGGEWISTGQRAVMGLAAELGLVLVDTGMDFISRDPVGGPAIPPADHDRLAAALAQLMREKGEEALGSMTAAELLDRLPHQGPAMTVLRSRLQGTAGAPLEWMAAAEIGEEFGIGAEGRYVRIEGGNDMLAGALGSGLDVRHGRIVTGVYQREGRARVVAGEEEYVGSAVVLAVPLGVLRHLDLQPGLPPAAASIISTLRMGAGAKVAIATEHEPPPFRRQDMDIAAWYWTGLGPAGVVRRAITGFAGSETGVAGLLGDAMARLRRAAPDCVLIGEPVIADWASDWLAGGCYSVIGPGQRAKLDALTQPLGLVHLAGEHVNGSGTIDGAILSGEAAARSLLSSGVS